MLTECNLHACSMLPAGASAVLATYPLDLVRTRLAYATEAPPSATQQSGPGRLRHRHPGIFSLLATTAKDEGLLGLLVLPGLGLLALFLGLGLLGVRPGLLLLLGLCL